MIHVAEQTMSSRALGSVVCVSGSVVGQFTNAMGELVWCEASAAANSSIWRASHRSTGERSVTAVTPTGNNWTATDVVEGGSAPLGSKNVRPAVGLARPEGMYWASVVDDNGDDRLDLIRMAKGAGQPEVLVNNRVLRKGSSVAFFPLPDGTPRLVYLDPSGTPQTLASPWKTADKLVTNGGGGFDDFAIVRPSAAGSTAVSFVGLRHPPPDLPPGLPDQLSIAFGAADLPLAAGPSGPIFPSDPFDTPPTVVAYLDGATVVTELFVSQDGFVQNIRCRGLAEDACLTMPQPPPLGMLHPRRLAAVAVPTTAP